MKRNIAFFVSSHKKDDACLKKSKKHFLDLSEGFGYEVFEYRTDFYNIYITYEDDITWSNNNFEIKFPIGNLGNADVEWDRFLKISIKNNTISIVNDYAGSIPIYYSTRDCLSLSNIEHCVVLDSNTTTKDFSYENIYGFMKFMHFIWDETAYNHIFTILPDSKYIFNKIGLESSIYLKTVQSSNKNINLSDKQVSDKLNDLNDRLVYRALSHYEKIILPLSSGYDSRMLLAALSKRDNLKDKLHCFTYGSVGSVEVEAAKRLTSVLGVKWNFIELPLQFLSKNYLKCIYNIFGSSLHMHGMYQLEFLNEIKKIINTFGNVCLTSGFMTGVPAGQHNGLLNINNNKELTKVMNKFSQSKYWRNKDLEEIPVFKEKEYIKKAEERFRLAFNRFEGEQYQKSVMFDIWTRQRNFISYYPRTLEWKIATVSPHMNSEYINFFMSISKKHLDNRFSVELMFKNYYPLLSKIVSNSNGLKSINNKFENFMFFISSVFRKFKINNLLPKKYANNNFEFDLPSLVFSGKDGIYPLLEENSVVDKFLHVFISKDSLLELYREACNGNINSYEKLITLQSLCLSVLEMSD